MRKIFEEYGDVAIAMVVGLGVISLFLGIYLTSVLGTSSNIISNGAKEEVIENVEPVTIDMNNLEIKNSVAYLNEEFDYTTRVKAINSKGEDISSFIYLEEDVDTSKKGEQEVNYILSYNGEKVKTKAKVIVVDLGSELDEKLD